MRALRIVLFAGGAFGLLALVLHLGAGSIASALTRLAWWEFAVICLLYAINVAVDTLGWRYTLPPNRVPLHRLLTARCAGEAANALSSLAAVGGEALKAWLLRVEVPYEESIPSLILAKTAEVLAQALLFLVGVTLAWTTGAVGPAVTAALGYLLIVEVVAVGGLLWLQIAGVVGKAGRVLAWVGAKDVCCTQRVDAALRGFYRYQWRRFLMSTALHFLGWVVGTVEALFILYSLDLSASFVLATILEALWSGVRLATFFVPASLGPLEGANAGAFAALGFGASAGLAFTLIRRARQAVWVGLGVLILMAIRPTRALAAKPAQSAPRQAEAA